MENRYYILETWWPVYYKKGNKYICLSGKHSVPLENPITREVNSTEAIEYLKTNRHALCAGERTLFMLNVLLKKEKEKFYKEVLNER